LWERRKCIWRRLAGRDTVTVQLGYIDVKRGGLYEQQGGRGVGFARDTYYLVRMHVINN
jgi:hypothetical protein